MPEKVPNKELDEKTARPEVFPIRPATPKPQSVKLEFDEADALYTGEPTFEFPGRVAPRFNPCPVLGRSLGGDLRRRKA